jgi:hypothetical protein
MTIDLKAARNFVYANGTLWERALFAYLFQGDSLERLHQTLLCYKNPDQGWGHALEHDMRCPKSNPLALEFLLFVLTQLKIPVGNLLDGSVEWLEQQREPDGTLRNPAELLDYPHAPWWDGGGQTIPDSIVGNLTLLGCATESLQKTTAAWVQANLTPEKIRANEWLFMAYHAYNYFLPIRETPAGKAGWQAAVENVIQCAENAPPEQYGEIFRFAPTADAPIARAMPPKLLTKMLDYVQHGQQSDGSWHDEHGLLQWYPYTTIVALHGLRSHGREIGKL